ncbi:MAG: transposase [Eubacterium sp.]|nr:transposase [Eubacterium sp.]
MYMPRQKRIASVTGVYHIMVRGVNKQRIFSHREDYQKYLQFLSDCKEQVHFDLYAFCLMPNHVHLLLHTEFSELERIMKCIGTRYASWYNWKYARVGHLFQDRYLSEVVEDEQYFLTVIRYIHRNPVKAMMVRKPDDYPYSSYPGYFTSQPLISRDVVRSYITPDRFKSFHEEENEDECMDLDNVRKKLSDKEAFDLLKQIADISEPADFQKHSDEKKKIWIQKALSQKISLAQIHRITGISMRRLRQEL